MSETSTLHDLHEASGKVREMYGFGDRLLMVASDRISAFDVVLPTPIPDKGRVLTGLSQFWFGRTEADRPQPPDHDRARRLPARGAGRARPGRPVDAGEPAHDDADRVRRARLPRRLGMEGLQGHRHGLRPQPPAGHGRGAEAAEAALHAVDEGHRRPRPEHRPRRRRPARRRGALRPARSRCRSSSTRPPPSTRSSGASSSPTRSSSSARTRPGRIVLGDEALTPDSSRFWPADEYATGGSPPSYDKQYVRDWLETLDWDKTPPGPGDPRRGRRRARGPATSRPTSG